MKKQAGQAFILVLILLAIGAVLVVPSLRLTSTALMNSPIVERQIKGLYAADAAQEYILWKLMYAGFPGEFVNDGDEINYNFYVCGEVPVAVSIIMRAKEGEGGMTLATDDVIRPTKMVVPDTVPNDTTVTVTYTIRLEQLSNDNSQGLDAIYDILPKTFADLDYEANRSFLSVDGGPWEPIPDPLIEVSGGQVRLQWPADYDWETDTDAFSSDPLDVDRYFHGIRDFEVRQVKELKFELTHTFSGDDKDNVLINWVVLKPWDTLSGPQAPITVGSPADPEVYQGGGLLAVSKTSLPEIIQPGVETDIEYTISITNREGATRQIQEIKDYLPTGFTYFGPSQGGFPPSGITTTDPQLTLENLNGVDRWVLRWTATEIPGGEKSIASGETLTQTFWTRATRDVSGSYYNELIVIPDVPVPTIFSEIGVSEEEYYTVYSWNTGAVIVPAYDTSSDAEGITINANMALILGGISITSWGVD